MVGVAGSRILSTGSGQTYIGSLRVAASNTTIKSVSNFTEYWGDSVVRDRVPQSRVMWTQPPPTTSETAATNGDPGSSGRVLDPARGNTRLVDYQNTRAVIATMGGK